jgi:hypothetical protein
VDIMAYKRKSDANESSSAKRAHELKLEVIKRTER